MSTDKPLDQTQPLSETQPLAAAPRAASVQDTVPIKGAPLGTDAPTEQLARGGLASELFASRTDVAEPHPAATPTPDQLTLEPEASTLRETASGASGSTRTPPDSLPSAAGSPLSATGTPTSAAGPPAKPARPTLRVGTVVWGLILALIGAGIIAVAAGARFDLQLAFIGLLALGGIGLLAGSIATSARHRNR